MSASEFSNWVAYVEENGPLDYQRRFDEPAALVAWATQAAAGGKAKIQDFLRYTQNADGAGKDTLIFDSELYKHFKA